jgi:hypothetical protein
MREIEKDRLRVSKSHLYFVLEGCKPAASAIRILQSSTFDQLPVIKRQSADVAELADALDSKSCIRKDVWVRPPPSAPFFSSLF